MPEMANRVRQRVGIEKEKSRASRFNDTRSKLLFAASKVFAEKGFAGATTREIAQRAGVFQPQIAYFFQGKEQLWKEAVNFIFSSCDEMLDRVLQVSGDDSGTRVQRVVEHYLTFAADNPEWAGLVVQEGLNNGERGDWLAEKWLQPRSAKLLHALTGRSLDELSGKELHQAISILAILTGAVVVFAEARHVENLADIKTDSHEFVQEHVRFVTLAISSAVEILGQ